MRNALKAVQRVRQGAMGARCDEVRQVRQGAFTTPLPRTPYPLFVIYSDREDLWMKL